MALTKNLVTSGLWPEQAKMLASDYPTVAAGTALTLVAETHADKVILLDTAAGSTVTLPASTGSGNMYYFRVTTSVTSNNHIIKVANATDVMRGTVLTVSSTSTAFHTTSTSDTITMNGSTTGGLVGSFFSVRDDAAGYFYVSGSTSGSSTAATVFSAGV